MNEFNQILEVLKSMQSDISDIKTNIEGIKEDMEINRGAINYTVEKLDELTEALRAYNIIS